MELVLFLIFAVTLTSVSSEPPSSSYGVPSSFKSAAPSSSYGPPRTFSKPSSRQADEDTFEPANYEFKYEVQDYTRDGVDFGHEEERVNDNARGRYHVLLPDGRVQVVNYVADREGYKPVVTYEGVGRISSSRSSAPSVSSGPY